MSTPLRQNRDFVMAWAGESVSLFGNYITYLAFPLTAVLVLHATPSEVGIINAARFVPLLFLPLFAGVWVDRRRRKPVLMAVRAGSAMALCVVPIAWKAGWLSIALMACTAFVIGALSVVDQIAYQAFVPTLVPQKQLVSVNSAFTGSESVASVAGPGAAGLLVAAFTAPVALLVDAGSFAFSVVTLLFVRAKEDKPTPSGGDRRVVAQIRKGLRLTLGSRVLVSIVGWSGTYNFFNSASYSLIVIFLVNRLRVTPGLVGVVFAIGGVGAFLGAMVARRVGDRFGIGRTMVGAMLLAGAPWLLMAFAHDELSGVLVFGVVLFINELGATVSNIHSLSLRQSVVPPDLLGTVMGAIRFLNWGLIPVGSLLGGVVGSLVGVRPALLACGAGMLLACAWPLSSKLPTIRSASDVTLDLESDKNVSSLS
jgi:MFS family permease